MGRRRGGLTLIELVLSVGLLLILAAIALWAINPIERQKQTRDRQRVEDFAALRQVIEAEESKANFSQSSTFGVPSGTAGVGASFKADGSGWVPMKIADFFPELPRDPRNGENFPDVLGSKIMGEYQFVSDGKYYILRTHLEAETNRAKYAEDGNDNSWYEVGTAPGLSTYFGL